MKKEDVKRVKTAIDQITGKNYRKTYVSRQETLHIRIGTYGDEHTDGKAEWLAGKEKERNDIIDSLKQMFPEFDIQKNNKRYQGFFNDICITVK